MRIANMGRWEPEPRARLEQAAIELYGERGFKQTTVAEIAKRAGLAERTFFRHFADKREVLFGGAAAFNNFLVKSVTDAPASVPPLDAIATALGAAVAFFEDCQDLVVQRHKIIEANVDLQERELIKLAALASALAVALSRRGVKDPAASLAAEAGVAVFKIAFRRWVNERSDTNLKKLIRRSFEDLKDVTTGA